jgi:hypothetical protein
MEPTSRGKPLVVVSLLALISSYALLTYLEHSPNGPSPLVTFLIAMHPNPRGDAALLATPRFGFTQSNMLLLWAAATGLIAASCLAVALTRPTRFVPTQRRAFVVAFCGLSLLCLGMLLPLLRQILRVVV